AMSSCVGCYPHPDVIRCPFDRIGFTTVRLCAFSTIATIEAYIRNIIDVNLYDTGETSLEPSRGATPSRLTTYRFNRPNPSFI
ncbi:hypothetical protein PIB30_109524, partial [Stylosanthes scabra]|nr:hypothetical protein [Stylosanthes scabra]